jgi:hypothetical protein
MSDSLSPRTLFVLVAALITILLVFTQGTVTAVLFAGLSFFIGSLYELFQHRDRLDRGRLILLTAFYTACVAFLLAALIWRYRELFI